MSNNTSTVRTIKRKKKLLKISENLLKRECITFKRKLTFKTDTGIGVNEQGTKA